MKTIKSIREAALKDRDERFKAIDHKANFTETQLNYLYDHVEDAVQEIFKKVKNDPYSKQYSEFYIGNATWKKSELNSYIHLCNVEIERLGYSEELEAELSKYSEHGNPNAYCAPEDLTRWFAVIKERKDDLH